MQRRLVALKLSIVGLAVGLFIFGWALIARTEAAKIEAQNSALRRTIIVPSGAVNDGQGLTTLPDLPPIPTLPPIRTRTS